jgi:hypothetical protein
MPKELFKKKYEHFSSVGNPEPTPEASSPTTPTATAMTEPQSSVEWKEVVERIRTKKLEAEKLLETTRAEADSLALKAQLGDKGAEQRINEIMQQAVQIMQETATLGSA